MLNQEELECLKVLLQLKEEQKSVKVTGSYTDFPVKSQIVYKEILEHLEEINFISDFEDILSETFIVTLQPQALHYLSNIKPEPQPSIPATLVKNTQTKLSGQKLKINKSVLSGKQNLETSLAELEALISLNGREDFENLTEILEEVKEFSLNFKKMPAVQQRKTLIKKIVTYSEKYPWLKEKIIKIFGTAMIEVMSGF